MPIIHLVVTFQGRKQMRKQDLSSGKITHYVDLGMAGEEVEFEIYYDYEPYKAGRLSGPPEDCYPAEGGVFYITNLKPHCGGLQEKIIEALTEDSALADAIWKKEEEHDES